MKPVFKASVRALVQKVEQSGDIHFRFSSRTTGLEGVKGHQKLQKSRGEGYLAEQSVKDIIDDPEFTLEVSGRADGYWPDAGAFVVEELKTTKADVELIPEQVARLHWGQLKLYGYLLAREHEAHEVTLRLTYYRLDLEQEFSFDDLWSMAELEAEYQRIVEGYSNYLRQVIIWRKSRDVTIKSLVLPFGEFRPGQREMAVSVYRALAGSSQVVLQAPTGIGKTMGSLFPAVKAISERQFDRVFYVSAKTSGQRMARDALEQMRQGGLKLRDVTLTAKEKICFNPGTACDPDHCQYAKGYFDKLPAVMNVVQQDSGGFGRERIEDLAQTYEVCPFELGLDLSELADVVIGDYNYVFDPTVYLRRHFDEPQKFALLMDESHNLVDRGRDMFSAALQKEDVLALRRLIGDASPNLKKALTAVNKAMLEVTRDVHEATTLEKFPTALERALGRFNQAAEAWLDDHEGGVFHAELLQMYFDVLRFLRVGEQADDKYAALVEKSRRRTLLRWYCIDPSTRLAEGFARLDSSVCFSATLTPQGYYRSLLGLEASSNWYQLPSPFDPEKLGVFVTSYLSTTYQSREHSLYDLVDTIGVVAEARSGNYIVYFPSYAYLEMVLEKFAERFPGATVIQQVPGMSDEERELFLSAFEDSETAKIGFAVMGGTFGEGIDLKGQRLIGVIVVGVGLPQIGIERNLIRDHFDQEGYGFEYAYQYPGMVRVLQTAGRVIRSEEDHGVVCLIDHRFNEASYRQLFPEHWQVTQVKSAAHMSQSLAKFWFKFEPLSL